MSLLIYGANGYTGELVARRAADRGPLLPNGGPFGGGLPARQRSLPRHHRRDRCHRGDRRARRRGGALGPNAAARAGATSHLWAEARDDAGRVARARLQTAEAYELTSWTAVELASRVLRGDLPAGFQTPAGACGADFILDFPRSTRQNTT